MDKIQTCSQNMRQGGQIGIEAKKTDAGQKILHSFENHIYSFFN